MSKVDTALVVGSSGALAKPIIKQLEDDGYRVIGLARRAPAAWVPTEFRAVEGPWTQETLKGIIEELEIDAIVNLAAAGVDGRSPALGAMTEANVLLPLTLVSAAAAGARAVISIGSGAEYLGGNARQRLSEDAPLTRSHPYGLSKAAGGLAAKQRADEAGILFAHLRLFGVFGENEAKHRLLPTLFRGFAVGEPVRLSDGLQVRDWLYERDVAAAISATVAALCGGAMNSGFYNLGSGEGRTVRAFAEAVADGLDGSRTLLDFGAIGRRGTEEDVLVADSALFQRSTGWEPAISFEDGLSEALLELKRRRAE